MTAETPTKGSREMVDALKSTLGKVVLACTIVAFISTPIAAMVMATASSKEARATADKALNIAEGNARDFAFFKGEVNAKLDYISKGQDRLAGFFSRMTFAED